MLTSTTISKATQAGSCRWATVGEVKLGRMAMISSSLAEGAFILRPTRDSARRAPCRSRLICSIFLRFQGSAQAERLGELLEVPLGNHLVMVPGHVRGLFREAFELLGASR